MNGAETEGKRESEEYGKEIEEGVSTKGRQGEAVWKRELSMKGENKPKDRKTLYCSHRQHKD